MTEPANFPATGMPDWDWWRELWPDPDKVLRDLDVVSGMRGLDLCCGDGYFTPAYRRILGADGTLYCLDLDPHMLAAARAHVDASGAGACVWIEGDARAVDRLVEARLDFVLIANTFHGVPDKTAMARAVARVLAPGGRFAVVNWHARPRAETPVLGAPRGPADAMRMTPAAVEGVVAPAGLVLDRLVELPPYHYGAVSRMGDD